jgi:hypothetical protein
LYSRIPTWFCFFFVIQILLLSPTFPDHSFSFSKENYIKNIMMNVFGWGKNMNYLVGGMDKLWLLHILEGDI